MTMWTIQQFCDATDSYGVRVAKLLAPPPAVPVSCNPASVAAGASNIVVTVTGTTTNGEGFFDPGAGFSNHLAVAVSGTGVSITNVQYIDPTHLTMNVSLSANAPSGARTLTVTNPDGQSAGSTTGILTVTGGNNAPTIESIQVGPSGVTIVWRTVPGGVYHLQYKSSFADPDWNDLPGAIVASGDTASANDVTVGDSQRFYRVALVR
jgi:hypothetical protein